ncbi:hypothetical protein [Prochlorococcus sp. MIT 0714]|uniref:hypothetical protein n=1 Tax=Prochlorococcus sp. MIT 0714 TaxID=3082540 RepID=UPI0039AF1102
MSSAESSKISAKAKNIVKLYFTSVIASFALFLVAVYLNPSNTDFIHKEDGLLENLSAGICFATFIFGIVLILRNCRYKKMLAGISFVSLLGFLDEISFGGRIFKIKYPRIFGVNIDGIHDFLSVAKRLVKKRDNRNAWQTFNCDFYNSNNPFSNCMDFVFIDITLNNFV